MRTQKCSTEMASWPLPALRFDIAEAAEILRMSRAQLYNRICEGAIRPQKDGARTYITRAELERYVDACADRLNNATRGYAENSRSPSPRRAY